MYNQSYEDYMRMVLGYQPVSNDGCMTCNTYMPQQNIESTQVDSDLQELYPNIYKILKPVIQKVCMENTRPMCREVLEDMTETVYRIVEEKEEVTTTASVTKTTTTTTKSIENRNTNTNSNTGANVRAENRVEPRRDNFLLRDLIRILILNQLLNQNRPPRPRPGPRPHFPGGPGRPPMPRMYDYI